MSLRGRNARFAWHASVVLLAIVAGCTEFRASEESDAGAPADDAAAASDGATPDSPTDRVEPDAGSCNRNAAFGALIPLGPSINTSGFEFSARLTPDQRRIVFMRAIDLGGGAYGDYNIYEATRPTSDAEFGAAAPIPSVLAPTVELGPSFGENGDLLVFSSDRPWPDGGAPGRTSLWAARRVPGDFDVPVLLAGLTSSSSERSSTLADNGRALYFVRDDAPARLYVSRLVSGTFDTAIPVAGIPVSPDLEDPALTSDQLTLYVKRDNAVQSDIYRATRTATVDPFGTLQVVPELSSADRESPTWISDDDCTIYIARNADIYVAKRPK